MPGSSWYAVCQQVALFYNCLSNIENAAGSRVNKMQFARVAQGRGGEPKCLPGCRGPSLLGGCAGAVPRMAGHIAPRPVHGTSQRHGEPCVQSEREHGRPDPRPPTHLALLGPLLQFPTEGIPPALARSCRGRGVSCGRVACPCRSLLPALLIRAV